MTFHKQGTCCPFCISLGMNPKVLTLIFFIYFYNH